MQPGTRIGKYVIEAPLGEGGNGAVYAARDSMLGRPVAIKVLHPHLVYDATVAARFRQEAQAMAQLNHPNVVIVHDFVASEPTQGQPHWAIVMELVEGGQTLGAVLRQGPLAPIRAARLVSGIASALGYAHARGIVHRDIKPANVMVVAGPGGTEIAKLTDFGIARVMHGERRTQAALTLGTIWYLAPEQAQSSSVDARADVYSLGVTLFEALTGRVPFPYDNVARALAAHVSEAPVAPSSVAPHVPPQLDPITLRCLHKSPAMRPANGEEVRALLDEAIALLDPTGSMRAPSGNPSYRPSPDPRSPRVVARTTPMAAVTPPGSHTPGPAPSHTPTPVYAPQPPPGPIVAPGPHGSGPPPQSLSSGEKRLGLYIGVGALVFVLGVCLLGGILCTAAFSFR